MILEGNLSNNYHIFKMVDGEKLIIKGGKITENTGTFINIEITKAHRIDIRGDKVLYHEIIRGDVDENN